MVGQLVPVVVGAGVGQAHSDGALGTVVDTFRHGCYVQVNGDTYAVAGSAVAPGPLHLILRQAPHAREGLTVWRDGGLLCSTEWRIGLTWAPVYSPLRPGPATLRHAAPNLSAMLERLAVPADLRTTWPQVLRAVAAGDLTRTRALLEGRGGGLTPTGDDVLAGVLLVQAWRGGDRDTLLRIAEAAATTNLSRSFLTWAARGQSLAPVHDLVASAALEDWPGFDHAFKTVSAIGGSSGTALLWGIGLAASASRAAGAVSQPV
jgi:hypothetical protein